MTRRASSVRGDDGSMLLLMLGVVVISALLVAVVVDASTLFLARMQLMSAADGAALSAAQAVDRRVLYTQPSTGSLPLDPALVGEAVRRYLTIDGDDGVQVLGVSTDGETVRVSFRREVRLPFVDLVTFGSHGSVSVSASAAAHSPFVG
jgi:hypothetical protein